MSKYTPNETAKTVWQTIRNRRSIRDYDLNKPIQDDVIYRILEAGTWAPSPDNFQPWRYILITDPKIKRLVGEKTVKGCIRDFGVVMPRKFVEEHMAYYHKKATIEKSVEAMATGWRMEFVKTAPLQVAIAVDVGELSGGEDIPTIMGAIAGQQTTPMALMSAGAALENIWLMASSMGLGAVFTDFALTNSDDEVELARMLNVPYPRYRITGFLCIGWPSTPRANGPPRHPVESVTFENRWGSFWKPKKKPKW
jgi:nitroreductase